jgi:hypothetical protein
MVWVLIPVNSAFDGVQDGAHLYTSHEQRTRIPDDSHFSSGFPRRQTCRARGMRDPGVMKQRGIKRRGKFKVEFEVERASNAFMKSQTNVTLHHHDSSEIVPRPCWCLTKISCS